MNARPDPFNPLKCRHFLPIGQADLTASASLRLIRSAKHSFMGRCREICPILGENISKGLYRLLYMLIINVIMGDKANPVSRSGHCQDFSFFQL